MPDSADLAVEDLRKRARRRLVGAILLALIAAVVLPVFLESDPKPLGQDVSIQIPPVSGGRSAAPRSGPIAEPDAARPAAEAAKPAADGGKPTVDSVKPPAGVASAGADASTPAGNAGVSIGDRERSEPARGEADAGRAAPAAAIESAARPAPKATESRSGEAMTGAASGSTAAVSASTATTASVAPAAPAKADPSADATKSLPAPEPAKGDSIAKSADRAPAADKSARPPAKGTYVVQVGALADPTRANEIAGRLRAAGHPVYVSEVTTATGKVYRVRVPGYRTREAAQSAMAKLRDQGYPGVVAEVK